MKFVTDEVNRSYCEVKCTDKEGIKQYAYCLFDYGVMPAPASTAVHIAFIIDGTGYYNGMKIKTGDVIAYGINKETMISRVENVAVFIVSMEFWLFYQMTRVFNATNLCNIQNQKSFKEIASDLNISYRQLQRDFNTILGITLKEYENIVRFHKAVNHLEEKNIVEAAVEAGYWDQSHMVHEFKRMCGYTPTYIKKNQTN